MIRKLAITIWFSLFAAILHAQTPAPPSSVILVVDQEALFTGTEVGQQILKEIDDATSELLAENKRIENELIAEEQQLTELRATLSNEEFRSLADAFDEKTQSIRATQNQKSDAIGQSLETQRREYFQAIIPILGRIMQQERAIAILNKRTVLISLNAIDVTSRAIAQINAELEISNDENSTAEN